MTVEKREHFVYWMFDVDGNCLYVGLTGQPEARWRQHRYSKAEMVARVAYKRMAGPFTLSTARALERQEQNELEPIFDERINTQRSRARSLSSLPDPLPRWSGLTLSGDLWAVA